MKREFDEKKVAMDEVEKFLAAINEVRRLTSENYAAVTNYFFMIERHPPMAAWFAAQAKDLNRGYLTRLVELYKRADLFERKICPGHGGHTDGKETATIPATEKGETLIFTALTAAQIAELCQLHFFSVAAAQVIKDICEQALKLNESAGAKNLKAEEEFLL